MSKIITDKGLEIISQRIKGNLTEPLNIAWGTGTTLPTAADIALQAEDTSPGYARVAGVSQVVSVTSVNDTYEVSGALTARAALTISEWGLFDSAGNLLSREVQLPGFLLAIGETMNFVFKFINLRK